MQENAQRVRGDPDHEHERRERAERMDVVRGAELPTADERVAEPAPLDHGGRDHEPEELEPRDAREVEEERT